MFHSPCHRVIMLAVALLGLACLLPAQSARADEPQAVIVALLFPVGETPLECLEDPIGIIFGVGSDSSSTTTTLSSVFGEPFGDENLNRDVAVYVSRDGVLEDVVWAFSSALPPDRGVMRLGSNSDAEVLLCERVSNNSGILEPDELGGFLLVIVAGEVR